MGRSTVHYADNKTNNALKQLHNKLRPAGTPVQRVEYIIELLLLRIFEAKLKKDEEFKQLRQLFTPDYRWKNPKTGKDESNENRLFSYLSTVSNEQILSELNDNFFPFYSSILQNARQVYKTNLPQKVQDQLVLIEEVFSNSNFTNNVNSGNLGEVISIVTNDIEEDRLLKTDLLGDAIESALSETGGTKDIGLYRTPDHIRQFMTALVEPTFADTIFDPACGTGGFLFDAFEFVMRRVDGSQKWPGAKAHKELSKWFNGYFKNNKLDFPSIEQTTQFYRSGVTGIEYLGVIRKMASINFYIRGLNPANIEQGDSLQKYSPVTDHESKSVILANPPFGAQRDQDAYPDVWSEFSKESETTILFVKLMFEQLKSGGRCAVVVSEGFNTWDQFSAKALRKMLLDEAQLKAVISLPQGLFVSKSGVGPKTSILLFEKGGKTDWTWFYKVTNDGYTMGTNRKEQAGCQLVECLDLFHKYVKKGIQPPETKNQFCVPAEWIKVLDPRIKESIRIETRTELQAKGDIDRKKKIKDLDTKVKSKKITEADKQMELKVFEQMLENKIQNEIAKRIDKAHNYSFNMANYKSSLSDSQITDWTEIISHIEPNGATSLDEIYRKLKSSKPEKILPYLVKLNPANALETDIAREYVNNVEETIVAENKEIYKIKEVLKSGAKYPIVKLKEYLILNENKIKPSRNPDVNYKVLGVSNEIGVFRNDKLQPQETSQSYFLVNQNEFCYNPYRINVGSIGLNTFDLDNQIISGAYIVFGCKEDELKPLYLKALFESDMFLEYVNDKASGGVRMNFKFEDMEAWEIPLPSLDEQEKIVSKIEKQKEIIDGAEKIIKNKEFTVDEEISNGISFLFPEIIETIDAGINFSKSDLSVNDNGIPYVKMQNIQNGRINIDDFELAYIDENLDNYEKFILRDGDLLINVRNSFEHVGKMAIYENYPKDAIYNHMLLRIRLKDVALPHFINYLFQTNEIKKKLDIIKKGSTSIWAVYQKDFNKISLNLPDIKTQQKIVDKLKIQSDLFIELQNMKGEAQNILKKLLTEIWGLEYIEPITEEN